MCGASFRFPSASPELHPEEAAGGVAGDAGVEVLGQPTHHVRIGVEQLWQDGEIIVVNDGWHFLADWAEPFCYQRADTLDLRVGTHAVALEIDEEGRSLLVVAEPPLQRDIQQR